MTFEQAWTKLHDEVSGYALIDVTLIFSAITGAWRAEMTLDLKEAGGVELAADGSSAPEVLTALAGRHALWLAQACA